MSKLVKKIKNGEKVELIEKETINNYLYQERMMDGGFRSQGEAILHSEKF